jgi:phage terminase large subunit GpA-like protein
MVNRWPDATELWDQYASIRAKDFIDGGDGSAGTKFYKKNRKKMDKGARVAWPDRKGNAVSAIQHAYDLKLRDEAAFQAEYQNDPLNDNDQIAFDLVAESLSRRVIPVNRNEIPAEAEVVTAFVDVQKELLFYTLMAWTPGGRGVVIDYGTFPDQETHYFSKSKLRRKMSELPGSVDQSTDTYHGLEAIAGDLFNRALYRADGATLGLQMMAVDAGYSESAAAVRRYCTESGFRGMIHPSIGKYIGANQLPWQQFTQGKRDQMGVHCRLQAPKSRSFGARELLIDTNWWKTWAAERLISPVGSDQAIALFEAEPHLHRMFAEHCTAEDPTITIGKTGTNVIEWKQNPGKPNNDYWDCLVGNCCVASLLGVTVIPEAKRRKQGKKPNSRGKAKLLGRAKRGGSV